MAIQFDELTDEQKLAAAEAVQRMEAIEAMLADIATERAENEIGFAAREQELKAAKNIAKETMRNIRKARKV